MEVNLERGTIVSHSDPMVLTVGVIGEKDKYEAIECCILHKPQSFDSLPLSYMSPTMVATSSGQWVCEECGKVCKSHGRLIKHPPIHKQHPCVGEPWNNLSPLPSSLSLSPVVTLRPNLGPVI